MFHFMQIWFKSLYFRTTTTPFISKTPEVWKYTSLDLKYKRHWKPISIFLYCLLLAFLFILFWLSIFWFKGKRTDQLQGLINRDRPPEKWRSPMSIFQALFAFLLWNVLLVTVDLFISQFFFHNSELWVV
jgi:ABC-type Fe3+ transport system permease subunit